MTTPDEHERRPFYACEACGVVYARFDPPETCRVCGSDLFIRVFPSDPTF